MSLEVNHLLEFGPFRIDPQQRLLLREGNAVPLSPKAFELLLVLVERSGQVVSKDELMNLLWPDTFVEESNLGQHVFQLRKALGESAQDPSYILTVPGRGYRFAHRVRFIPLSANGEIAPESDSGSQVAIANEIPTRQAPASVPKHRRIYLAVSAAGVVVAVLAAMTFRFSPSPKALRVRQITHSGRVAPYGKVLSDGARLYFTETARRH